ncbi:hypothetical protein EYF88_06720 [Paracoccus sediminis]|uniref:Uncharacterized protein n=1 Tax=Paracoccus sediminis TaxID=1214787 RepID=A0A238W0Q5_9RHOB|nr:hypothetical protein [Paracoccus sediminis]TBN51478.1 hypothetical protein EYF88_06720 [Paracoccus sediminis]SNR40175.1 hypothetical protein SAMN06265378_103255 [Paracoccus sediminis]
MTRDDLLEQLNPPRLPLDMAVLGWREILALVGIGILAGLLAALVLRPLMGRRPSRRARILATRGMPPQDRILAVARILGRLPDPLRPAAYGAAPAPDDDAITRAALRRARR